MKFTFYLTVIVLCGCFGNNSQNDINSEQKDSISEILNQNSKVPIEGIDQDKIKEEEPVKTVLNFLNWYKENRERLNEIRTVNNYFSNDTTKYYSVNFTELEKYLAEFWNSGYVTEDFIKYWRNHFTKSDQEMKKYKQNDGPPFGFDFDIIFWSSAPEEDVKAFQDSKYTLKMIDDNNAIVSVSLLIKVTLVKNDGKWMIKKTEGI